jgi:hypothetical protein
MIKSQLQCTPVVSQLPSWHSSPLQWENAVAQPSRDRVVLTVWRQVCFNKKQTLLKKTATALQTMMVCSTNSTGGHIVETDQSVITVSTAASTMPQLLNCNAQQAINHHDM